MRSRDEELSRRLAATLDDSIDTLDAETRARLAAARHAALTRNPARRVLGGLALAASLVALIAVPWSLRHNSDATGSDDMSYLSVDPQMLADLDMLQGMDDLQSSGDTP